MRATATRRPWRRLPWRVRHHARVPKQTTRTSHLYLWFRFIMFMVGGAMAMADPPGRCTSRIQFLIRTCFNHSPRCTAADMVFGASCRPSSASRTGRSDHAGAPDMAFARLHNWSFWTAVPISASRWCCRSSRRAGRRAWADALRAAHGADGHGIDLTILCRAPVGIDRFRLDHHHYHHSSTCAARDERDADAPSSAGPG